ncbi:alpha-2-macroglobulin-like isoform X2 [Lytechinus variegatus]|uniref:alpha-2-macroglobulin-like isoform X2 n=1 Tax=Lytechinus variegatus TaxID=7654 RepID=UPI001BB23D41|nr:alpha-2-macroglobulin-like isoform X2 [Lytechinus variegatus]
MVWSNVALLLLAVCFKLSLSTVVQFGRLEVAELPVPEQAEVERGLVITFPGKVHLNSTERVCFTAANVTGSMGIEAKFVYGLAVGHISTWTGAERDGCVNISTQVNHGSLPRENRHRPPRQGQIDLKWFVERTPGILTLEKTYIRNVAVVPLRTQTFIQSDKPIYQPGQKVLFRVMTLLYPSLLPDTENRNDIWITSPSGTRIQQWRNQISSDGLLDLTFELAEEPELGDWRIHVGVFHPRREEITSQVFKVQEYVLPKFDVSIRHPSFIYAGTTDPITVTICAKYTYGQPVRGHISAVIAVFDEFNRLPGTSNFDFEEEAEEDTGCKDITVEAESLLREALESRYSRRQLSLYVSAHFTERGTGVMMNATSRDAKIEKDIFSIKIKGPDYFKPLLPYRGKVVLTYPDGSPVGFKTVIVSCRDDRQSYETRADGTAEFTIDTTHRSSITSLSIRAEVDGSSFPDLPEYFSWSTTSRAFKGITAWYSPSGSFLQISDITDTLSINQPVPVHLHFTLPRNETQITFFYRIISGGRITASGNYSWTNNAESTADRDLPIIQSEIVSRIAASSSASSRSRRQLRRRSSPFWPGYEDIAPELPNYHRNGTKASAVFFFNAISEMSPSSKILVYYIRKDNEVVSASTNFKMAAAFKNQVSVEFVNERVIRPGQTASIALNARNGSLCALGVVDRSVHILGGDNQLSKEKVMNPLNSLNPVQGSFNSSCPTDSSRSSSSKHADSAEGFRKADVGFYSDLKLETRPCWERRTIPCTYWRCFRDSPRILAMMPQHRMPGLPGPMPDAEIRFNAPVAMQFDMDMVAEVNVVQDTPGQEETPITELRNYFPETWLWKLNRIGSTGQHVIEEEIPHTITEWVANAFCLSSQYGIGVAETTSIRAFQPFFLSYTIPYSIIRGEKAPVKVTVFNYLSQCLNIRLSMTESSNFTIETRPESETVEVCGNSADTLEYEIIPTALGDIPIRVTAVGEPSSDRGDLPNDATFTDALEDTILVEPEGAEREETFSELICPHDESNGVFEQTISLDLPSVVVEGSTRGRVQVIGDIMGPVMSNLDSLLRMPFGCGEQNMIFMAPNIYVMQYLSLTNQLTSEIKEKALKFMASGYQRELGYQLMDHSYSAFGQSDGVGSTWLTAFVLKCFSQARDFMDIDERDLARTKRWLISNPQDHDNGCLVTRGRVIHREMQGAVTSPVTMTAFVLISLMEAGGDPQEHSLASAFDCLRSNIEDNGATMDTYTLAISSYALGLGGDYVTQAIALNLLNGRAHGNAAGRYWKRSELPSMDEEDDHPHCHSFCKSDSSAVEITSYILLAYMHRNMPVSDVLIQTMPMVKWLNTQRNGNGGFSSTQDTVLGLQALSEFAELAYDPEVPLDVTIDVSATRASPNNPQELSFTVDHHNSLVLQREELEEVPTELTLTATGRGCVLFQAEMMYNVPVSSPNRLLFDITTTVRDWETNAVTEPGVCGDKILDICVRYVGSDNETGMATMEVKMVSGYVPHEQFLNELQRDLGHAIGFKRFDKYKPGEPLSLYFDKFDNVVRCIPIKLKQEMFVKDTKDAVIKVYDYYKPAVVGFKSYNTCEAEDLN